MTFEVGQGLGREADVDPLGPFQVDHDIGVDLFDLENPNIIIHEIFGVVGASHQ